MKATVQRVDSMFCVVLGKETVAKYNSKDNAKAHRDAINMALFHPQGLNQKPVK